jgi:small subunit ribosomal protein S8
MTDPITDMLNRIRNAQAVSKEIVEVSFSRIKGEIVKILEEAGYLKKIDLRRQKKKKILKLSLKYQKGQGAIAGLRKISKPGQRIYAGVKDLNKYKKKSGLLIISSSQGIIDDKKAKKQKLGGEIICEIW